MSDSNTNTGLIAIVDDDESVREALGSVLKAAGYPVVAFASAEEFFESAHRRETLCLLLDVRLPGMSGVELQRKLLDNGDRTPIVFVTGHGDLFLRDSVLKAGASGFLNKPVRSDALLREIRIAVGKSEMDSQSC